MKRDVIRKQLEGIENRVQARKTKRQLMKAEHLERKRLGQVREYYFDKEKRA